MSSINVSQWAIIKKQFMFKVRSYSGMIWTLMVLQLLALFFSFNGVGSSGGGFSLIQMNHTIYNANFIIVFTFLWMMISAIIVTTKAYQLDDYTFITTRRTSHISNALFLVAAGIYGALTAMLAGHMVRVFFILRTGDGFYTLTPYSLTEWLTGFAAVFFYLMMFASVGYAIGMLFQMHVYVKVAAICIVFLLSFSGLAGEVLNIRSMFLFYFSESDLIIFMFKTAGTSVLLFALTLLMTDRLEAGR